MASNKRRQREREEKGDDDPLELKLYNDPWTIKKKLTESDVNDLCRLILPRNQVEKHVLPFLNLKEQQAVREGGLVVMVKDLTDDQGNCCSLSFKQWKSRTYKLGLNWISDMVSKKGLRKGDVIGLFWDNYSRCFCFSVIDRFRPAHAAIHPPPPPPPPDPSLCEFGRKDLRLRPPMPEP